MLIAFDDWDRMFLDALNDVGSTFNTALTSRTRCKRLLRFTRLLEASIKAVS